MGGGGSKVGEFFAGVGKAIAKGATSALGDMVPVVGPAMAKGLNSLYAKGGRVHKFDMGGVEVPAGFKEKKINTPAQLIQVIKAFPNEAADAGLTVQDVKEAAQELKTMKRGGRRHKEESSESESDDGHMVARHAHGGRVASLPFNNMDRLNRYASGGPVELSRNEHEQSFAVLHHGHPHGHGHHSRSHAHSHHRSAF